MITEIEVFDFWGPAWRVRYGPVLCPFPWAGRLPHGESSTPPMKAKVLYFVKSRLGLRSTLDLARVAAGRNVSDKSSAASVKLRTWVDMIPRFVAPMLQRLGAEEAGVGAAEDAAA